MAKIKGEWEVSELAKAQATHEAMVEMFRDRWRRGEAVGSEAAKEETKRRGSHYRDVLIALAEAAELEGVANPSEADFRRVVLDGLAAE